MTTLFNALLAGLITVSINGIAMILFGRLLKERDESIRLLNAGMKGFELELKELNDKRLVTIEHNINHAAGKRKEMYEYTRDHLCTTSQCNAKHDHMRGDFTRIEKQLTGIYAQLSENNAQTTRTAAVVDLMASQMNISIGKTPHTKGQA